MKFFKMLFSKILISFVALLIQLALIIAVILFFDKYFFTFQILNALLGLFVFLYVINKNESPEFKLPWLVILLILPLFGTAIYVMFANSKMPLKQFKRMVDVACRCNGFTRPAPESDAELSTSLGGYAGIENYLRKTSFSRGSLYNKTEYFPSGEEFYTDLLSELEKAEKFIFMEYFIIDYGKMWEGIRKILARKAAEGVEVRVMYDDIGTAGLLKTFYYKKLRKEGIYCVKFNPFRPVVSGIHNNRDHRKITVIDGRCAYTGGVNIADEYINEKKRFGHWKDTALKVYGGAVKNFTVMFLEMFDATSKTVPDYAKYLDIENEKFEGGGYVHPFGDGPKPFYSELVGSNTIINIVNAAKKYVHITTPYLIPDYNLVSALRSAAMRGIDVKIITPHIPDKKIIFNMTRSNYKYLLSAGVKIYEYTPGFIHAKGVESDGIIAMTGTINLDYRSFVHHYECGVVLYKEPCIKDIAADFENTLAVSQEITEQNFKMNAFASLVNAVLKLFSPML